MFTYLEPTEQLASLQDRKPNTFYCNKKNPMKN